MLDEFIMVWLRISKWILPIVLIQVLLLFFWEFLVQSGWLCISITLSLTLQCKNYIHFSFFSYQTDRELNFDVETAIKVNACTTELKKLCENGTFQIFSGSSFFFLQYLFLILGVSSGRIFQACGVFSGEIRTTRLVSLRKKDRMFVTSVRTFSVLFSFYVLRYWHGEFANNREPLK